MLSNLEPSDQGVSKHIYYWAHYFKTCLKGLRSDSASLLKRKKALTPQSLLAQRASCWATSSWQGTLNSSPSETNREREGERGKEPLEGAKAGLSDVTRPALFGQVPPHPPSPPLASWPLQEFPSSSHYSEETAGNAPHRCTATADRAEAQTCDCLCWHRSVCTCCAFSGCLLCPDKGGFWLFAPPTISW